jgi:signal transduction histidine kinase
VFRTIRERLSWEVVREPGTRVSEDRASMARTFAYLYCAGGTLLLITLFLPHSSDWVLWPLVMNVVLANLAGVVFLVAYDRLPLSVFKLAPALGAILIGIGMWAGGANMVAPYAMFFFWVTLSAAYFFDLRVALANVGFAVGLYAAVLALKPEAELPALQLVMAAGTLFVAAILMVQLRVHAENAQEEADRNKAEFFALVSHELRTPLTSIIGYLELVRGNGSRPPGGKQVEFLDVIHRNSRRLLRLVGDLLFIAQIQASGVELERAEFELEEVVNESVETFRARATREGIELRVETGDVPTCSGDAGRMGQVLDNLISNAIKFTPEGGSVTVRLHPEGATHAAIEVADTGMGIPVREQDRLFEDFYRSSGAKRLAIEGTGLGLAIVKTIVDAHGGDIELRSILNRGTTVRIRLPIAGTRTPSVPARVF